MEDLDLITFSEYNKILNDKKSSFAEKNISGLNEILNLIK